MASSLRAWAALLLRCAPGRGGDSQGRLPRTGGHHMAAACSQRTPKMGPEVLGLPVLV